jgi:hypothetical protein
MALDLIRDEEGDVLGVTAMEIIGSPVQARDGHTHMLTGCRKAVTRDVRIPAKA